MILIHNLIRYRRRFLSNRPRCASKFRTDRQTDELRVKRSIRILCWAAIAQSVQRLSYGSDGAGIESRWERDFPHPPDRPWGPSSLLYSGYQERSFDHPPLSSSEIKERAELYLFSPSGPSWPVLGWTLPFYSIRVLYICVHCLFLFVAFISFFVCFRV